MALEERAPMDLRTELAKAAIAREIRFKLCEGGIGELWEDYPDIGEGDWLDICRRVESSDRPSHHDFAVAYAHLAGRADHS